MTNKLGNMYSTYMKIEEYTAVYAHTFTFADAKNHLQSKLMTLYVR